MTPSGQQAADFDSANPDFSAIEQAILFHKQMDGRPVFEHRCPVVGHQIWLYADSSK